MLQAAQMGGEWSTLLREVCGGGDNLFKTVRGKNERQLETMKNKRLCRNAENALLAKE